jgi:hypothetical protein
MRAARSEYDAPSVGTADASDIGLQLPAVRGVLEGTNSAFRDVALFNAAAALADMGTMTARFPSAERIVSSLAPTRVLHGAHLIMSLMD